MGEWVSEESWRETQRIEESIRGVHKI